MSSYPENDKTVVVNGDYVLSVRGFLKIIESVSKTDVKCVPECWPEAKSSHGYASFVPPHFTTAASCDPTGNMLGPVGNGSSPQNKLKK